jgi:HEAT repeat protein
MFQGSCRWCGGVFQAVQRSFTKRRASFLAALLTWSSWDVVWAEEPMFAGLPARQVILKNWEQRGWSYSGTNRALIEDQMGPKIAVPALVSIMQDADWPGSPTYRNQWNRLPELLRKSMPPPRSYSLQERAVFILGQFDPLASNAIPALVRAMERGSDDQKIAVAAALIEMAPASAAAVEGLAKELPTASPEVKIGVLLVLQKLGPLAQAAVPQIRKETKEAPGAVRAEAVCALWMVARDTNAVLAALRPMIVSASPDETSTIGRTLYEMGPSAGRLVPDLLTALPNCGLSVTETRFSWSSGARPARHPKSWRCSVR